MRAEDLSVGNQLRCCDGRWTLESCVRKSVIDYMLFGKAIEVIEMAVDGSGKLDVGSGHNLIWSEVIWERREVRRREWYKWREDGKLDWEESGGSRGSVWEEEVRELEQELR